jgi:threonine/homoserine/homoserine lactone efflux protein
VSWLPFLAVVVVAYVVPGPDLAVILRAAAVGRRCALRAGVWDRATGGAFVAVGVALAAAA